MKAEDKDLATGLLYFLSCVGRGPPAPCCWAIAAHWVRSGLSWFNYDELFRQKLAVYPQMQGGVKEVGLWLNLMLPASQPSLV